MGGGSREKESENDRQCRHCGLWFGAEGVLNHEESCDMADFEARKVPLSCPFAVMRADDVEADDVEDDRADDDRTDALEASDHERFPDAELTIEPDDRFASDAPPTTPSGAGSDPTPGEVEDGVRGDGGPLAVPAFENDDDEGDEGEDALACPGCGGWNLADPEEELPEEALRSTPAVREFDHICIDCSTDENGTWTSPVEVFNA